MDFDAGPVFNTAIFKDIIYPVAIVAMGAVTAGVSWLTFFRSKKADRERRIRDLQELLLKTAYGVQINATVAVHVESAIKTRYGNDTKTADRLMSIMTNIIEKEKNIQNNAEGLFKSDLQSLIDEQLTVNLTSAYTDFAMIEEDRKLFEIYLRYCESTGNLSKGDTNSG